MYAGQFGLHLPVEDKLAHDQLKLIVLPVRSTYGFQEFGVDGGQVRVWYVSESGVELSQLRLCQNPISRQLEVSVLQRINLHLATLDQQSLIHHNWLVFVLQELVWVLKLPLKAFDYLARRLVEVLD